MARKRKQQEEPVWIVSRLTGTPAKYIGRIVARTEEEAIERAIKKHDIPLEQRGKLMARREE